MVYYINQRIYQKLHIAGTSLCILYVAKFNKKLDCKKSSTQKKIRIITKQYYFIILLSSYFSCSVLHDLGLKYISVVSDGILVPIICSLCTSTHTTYLISLIAYLFSKECLQWDIQMLDTQFEACDLQWPLQAKSDEHVVALQIIGNCDVRLFFPSENAMVKSNLYFLYNFRGIYIGTEQEKIFNWQKGRILK